MNYYYRVTISILLFCSAITAMAQNTKKKKPASSKPAVETPVIDPRIQRMTQNTQRVFFIDSMLVPRSEILNRIPLTPQAGRLTADSEFNCFGYQNELGTRSLYTKSDYRLYASQLVGRQMTDEQELRINGLENFNEFNSPYLLNDGQTLYFAAKGSESIGGYDIFITRYNSETRSFLKPENIGMPFNSEADDLLYIIDEGNNIGYFATTRRQPEGYVCIYRFVPTESRQTYDSDSYETLERLAAISSVKDTWGDGTERQQALDRIANFKPISSSTAPQMAFVINDRLTYHSTSDFRAPGNTERYRQLCDLQQQLDERQEAIQKSRNYYNKATVNERQQLAVEMHQLEQDILRLEQTIHSLEKEIRNNENQILNQ